MAVANPDHALLLGFLERPGAPRLIDSNPVAMEYGARLLAADRETGSVQLGFELASRHCQGNQIVQGGILTVLLDFAMAFAALTQLPPGTGLATVSLDTHFLRAAVPGPCTVRGRIERLGRSLAFGAAELHLPDDKAAVATATAVMAVRRM